MHPSLTLVAPNTKCPDNWNTVIDGIKKAEGDERRDAATSLQVRAWPTEEQITAKRNEFLRDTGRQSHPQRPAVPQASADRGRQGLKRAQRHIGVMVADRIRQELADCKSGQYSRPEVFVVHGAPGTGKSFTIKKLLELFRDLGLAGTLLGPAAFMASAADSISNLVDGFKAVTLHSLFNIRVDSAGGGPQATGELTSKLKGKRWLIIDEIFAVGSILFANVIKTLKDRCDGPYARVRPETGGLNII
eukprot:Hpha_TRINITY_DN16524_c1_g1::TRINITY_DN16524_c1_g1_i2::g.133763::m.133763